MKSNEIVPILIKKRSRAFEQFDLNKFKKSILKSGLEKEKLTQVIHEIGNPKDYFSTAELSSKTYKLLLRHSKAYAANYNLKKAIQNLGPTGYPFEILCGQILQAKGYNTQISVIVEGKYVKHEVDVIAKRQDKILYCECKFHSKYSFKNDVKVPLYIHSRWIDIQNNMPNKISYALISNTSFSKDAMAYANGVGLELYSLCNKHTKSILDLIKKYKVYPITSLKSLPLKNKKNLLNKGIVTIKELNNSMLEKELIELKKIKKIMQEITILTRPN
ncbi:MAG: restriction endonuclease [Bacteriovoracaceae bacterium]|nr:restriction endonuclease [Bacteriovoracaceae bacterium]